MPDTLDTTSQLQLYLAGEMTAAERGRVEQMLQADAAAREELEQLRALKSAAVGLIDRADRERPLPMSAEAAVRRFARDANQWNADRLSRQRPEPEVRRGWNVRAWSAVAAVLVLSLTLYIWHRIAAGEDQFATSQPANDIENVADGPQQHSDQTQGVAKAPGAGGAGGAGTLETATTQNEATAVAEADVTPAMLGAAPLLDEGQQQVRSAERELEAIAVLTNAGDDDEWNDAVAPDVPPGRAIQDGARPQ
jgi:hypothetical protein